MKQRPDSINQWLLKKKILWFSPFAVPEMIERLKGDQDATLHLFPGIHVAGSRRNRRSGKACQGLLPFFKRGISGEL
jgi:hypothetical protein